MRRKMRLTVFAKVLMSPLLVILLLGIVGGTSYSAMRDMVATLDDLGRREALLDGSRDIQQDLLRELASIRDYIISSDETALASVKEAQESLSTTLDRMIQTATVESTREQFRTIQREQQQCDEILEKVASLGRKGEWDQAAATLRSDVVPRVNAMLEEAAAISDKVKANAEKARTTAQADARQTQVTILVTETFAMIAGWILSLVVARSIVKPVRSLAAAAAQMAAGDLSTKPVAVTSHDEVGDTTQAFNTMLARLRDVVQGISLASESVMAASEQLSAAAEQAADAATGSSQAIAQVAAGTSEQASGTAEVNAKVEQLQEVIQQIAASASKVAAEDESRTTIQSEMTQALDDMARTASATAAVSNQTAQRARAGTDVVARTLHELEQVATAVGQSAERIKELDRLSGQIGSITDMISGIADQTNLLALNAAIEAARAGEHGRGFAVVAEEVRKLAEQSARSAGEISTLIRDIQNGTAEAVKAMSLGTERVTAGNKLAAEAGEALQEILNAVEQAAVEVERIVKMTEQAKHYSARAIQAFSNVAAITRENTAASQEMAASVTEVTDTVDRIARLAEENAAASEEVSASVEELTASAEQVALSAKSLARTATELQERVRQFQL